MRQTVQQRINESELGIVIDFILRKSEDQEIKTHHRMQSLGVAQRLIGGLDLSRALHGRPGVDETQP